jgi:hypothetical protein
MSSKFSKGAILVIATCAAACGDDAGAGTSGAGGDDEGAASTAATIVGPSSTSSGDESDTGAGAGTADGGGDATSASGGGDASGGSDSGSGGSGAGSGSGGDAPVDACPDFASEVIDVAYGPGAGFGQDDFPHVVLGGPRGAGEAAGSLHVLSLGNGGSITLGFADRRIVDGEGPDFIVFENAFWAGGDSDSPYAELGTVEVSADGEEWLAFPCTALEPPFGSCAGWRPVLANVNDNEVDPLDPAVAGGDAYDLADVGLAEARWVRIVDRSDQAGFAGMFDLDAVAIVHGTCVAAD